MSFSLPLVTITAYKSPVLNSLPCHLGEEF